MMIPLRYNVRSLLERGATTTLTVLSIAFVVLVFIGVMSMASGMAQAFGASGDPNNLLVLRDGARTETESYTGMDNYRAIAALPDVERDASGTPLASGELLVLQIFERKDGTESNLSARGVGPAARLVRPRWKLLEGRDLQPGKNEVIVGENLVGRFPSLELGKAVKIGRLEFQVVGVFGEGGGSSESEVWGTVEEIGDTFRRQNFVSSIRLRTSSKDAMERLEKAVTGDQRWRLAAKPEERYYAEQTEANTAQLKVLGIALAVLMGFGACFAAANTMYAQVARRAREIGTLRAVGFQRRYILLAFLFESAVLGFLGGVAGALLSLPLNGIEGGTTNFFTFSEMTFELATSPLVLLAGVVIAVLTGLIGGLPPAVAASRRPISAALREA